MQFCEALDGAVPVPDSTLNVYDLRPIPAVTILAERTENAVPWPLPDLIAGCCGAADVVYVNRPGFDMTTLAFFTLNESVYRVDSFQRLQRDRELAAEPLNLDCELVFRRFLIPKRSYLGNIPVRQPLAHDSPFKLLRIASPFSAALTA